MGKGYSWDGSNCVLCPDNKGSTDGSACVFTVCQDYYYPNDATTPTACLFIPILNCREYDLASKKCTKCRDDTYDITSDGKCQKTTIAHCQIIATGNASECSKCESGYYPDATSKFCLRCAPGCKKCASAGICDVDECDDGKYIDATYYCTCPINHVKIKAAGGTGAFLCKPCNEALDSHCVECTGFTCTKCTENGQSNGVETTVITAGDRKGFCTCPEKYYINDSGVCTACTDLNCLVCPNDKCTTCKDSTYYATSTGACKLCTAAYAHANCHECSSSDGTTVICTLCIRDIMYPPSVGKTDCSVALIGPTNCPTGKFYTQKHCKACSADAVANRVPASGEDFWLCQCADADPAEGLVADACSPCTGECATCELSTTDCSSCKPGFYGATCANACATDCLTCDFNTGNCLTCANGWSVISATHTCVCDAGKFKKNSHCYDCSLKITGCTQCLYSETDSSFSCTVCDASTGSTDVITSAQDLDQCTCSSGFFKSGATCSACSANCITCSDGSTCTACAEGYFLESAAACIIAKTLHCKTYGADPFDCTVCDDNYFLNTVTLQCIDRVEFCKTYTSELVCSACQTGYTVTSDLCVPEGYYMKYCQKCSGILACTTCQPGYYLRSDKKGCVRDCKYDLSGAVINYFNKNKTKCITDCTTESAFLNLQQTQCVAGCDLDEYANAAGKCTRCSNTIANGGWGPGCIRCDATNKCTSCDPKFGYVWKDGTKCSFACDGTDLINIAKTKCIASNDAACTKKSSDGKSCVSACTADYEVDDNDQCKLCQAITALENCLKCSSISVCTECFSGYYLESDDNPVCVVACGADATNKYISKDQKTCIASCGTGESISRVGGACVDACQSGSKKGLPFFNFFYLDEFSKAGTATCTLCNDGTDGIAGCKACAYNGATLECSTCFSGYYISSDKRTCTAYNCGTKYLSKDGVTCVDTCASESSYIMSGEYKKCTNDCWANDNNNYINDVNNDGSSMKCVKTCPTGKYKLDTNHSCVTCPSGCSSCTSATACTTCNTGKYLSKDSSSCIADCSDEAAFINLAKTQCVALCSDTGHVLSIDGISCVTACNEDEIVDTGVCYKCSSKIPYCSTCSSTTCTKCISGYLEHDSLSCVETCAGSEFIDADRKNCVTACPSGTFESINALKPKCVRNCKADDSSLYDVANKKCIKKSVCNTDTLTTYADFNDEYCLLCVDYSAGMAQCSTCSSNGTHVLCTVCAAGNYLKADKSGCLKTCKHVNELVITGVTTQCVTACPSLPDLTKDKLDTDGYTCVAAADCDTSGTTEFILDNVCYKCNNYPNIDTENRHMRNCEKCSAKDACLECIANYHLRLDFKGCVASCTEDDSPGTGTKYQSPTLPDAPAELTAGRTICMINCDYTVSGATAIHDTIDATTVTKEHATACKAVASCSFFDSDPATAPTYCLGACPEGQWADTDKICKSYLSHCLVHTSATVCTTCYPGYLLHSAGTSCTAECTGEIMGSDKATCVATGTAADGVTSPKEWFLAGSSKLKYTNYCGIYDKTYAVKTDFECELCKNIVTDCLNCDIDGSNALTKCYYCANSKLVEGTGVTCVTGCSNTQYPFINKANKKCIANCWQNDEKRFSNTAGDRCIDSCLPSVVTKTTGVDSKDLYKCATACATDGSEYQKSVSHYLGTTEKFCTLCSENLFKCKTCTSDGVTCLTCDTSFKLDFDPTKGCLAICPAGQVIDTITNKCKKCNDESKVVSNDLTICITACPSTQYVNSDHTCTLCSSAIKYCSTCSSASVCTQCTSSTYKLSKDGTKCYPNCYDYDNQAYYYEKSSTDLRCIDACSNVPGGAYIPSALNLHKCIVNCSIESTFYQNDGAKCLKYCPAGQYGKTLTHKCELCTEAGQPFENCTACYESSSGIKLCKTCGGSQFLKADKLGCISDCTTIVGSYLNLLGTACTTSCTFINSAKSQCTAACVANEYANTESQCIVCQTKITNCLACKLSGTLVLCTDCDSGSANKYIGFNSEKCMPDCTGGYISSDGKRCVIDCFYDDSSAYIAVTGTTCIQTCTGHFISSNLKKCVDSCETNEYKDTTNCLLCSAGIASCNTCSKSTGTLLCSKCDDNYWLSLDHTKCNLACLGTDLYPLNYASCTTNCQCIEKCVPSGHVLQNAGIACASACETGEYSDLNDADNKKCQKCNVTSSISGIANCLKCTATTTAVTCTECETGYYMKADGTACAVSCQGFSEKQVPGQYTCVASCPGTHVLLADGWNCRLKTDGCLDGEYLDSDGVTCKYCNSGNGFTSCTKCIKDECTQCNANYFRNFNSKKVCLENCADASLVKRVAKDECVTNCKAHDSSILSVDLKNCVASCKLNLGADFKLSIDGEKCLYPFESCGDDQYFGDTNSDCVLCSTVLTNCNKCSSRTVCTECSAAGLKLLQVSATDVKCVSSCEDNYKLNNDSSVAPLPINCVQNCSANADSYTIENSAGSACTTACKDDEWLNPSGYNIDGSVVLKSLKKCYTCNSIGGTMKYCDRCSTTTKSGQAANTITKICQRCINGFLSADKKGCVTSCLVDTSPFISGTYLAVNTVTVETKVQKYCVEDCLRDDNAADGAAYLNVPLFDDPAAGGYKYHQCINKDHCIDYGQFLQIDGKACIQKCLTDQYVDSLGNACKECKYANSNDKKMEYCDACYYDTGSSSVKCTHCSNVNYFLKLDKSGCTLSCFQDGHYTQYSPSVAKNTNKCITDCYNDDYYHKGQTLNYTCQLACETQQYESASHFCHDCQERYYKNNESYYQNCTTCSDRDVCLTCSSGYFRKDDKGCILDCNNETEFDYIVNYNLGTKDKCVKYCKSEGAFLNIVGDDYDCVSACTADVQYLEKTTNEDYCRECSYEKFTYPHMINCTKCTGPAACTECDQTSDSKYLKSDKTGCVGICPSDEFLSVVGEIKECYANQCPSGQYHADNSQQCIFCITTYNANCATCDASYCTSCSSGYISVSKTGCQALCSTTSHFLSSNKKNCVSTCLPGYFNDNYICKACHLVMTNCYQCSTSSICTSCIAGYFVDASNLQNCVLTCPIQQIADYSLQVCKFCYNVLPNCEECAYDASGAAICSKCKGNYYLYQLGNTCHTTCPTPLFNVPSDINSEKGNLCLQSCPFGSAQISGKYDCAACHESCGSCTTVGDKNTCLTCASNYYKSETLCVKCNKGYYLSKVTNVCQQLCEEGYYSDQSTRECFVCNSACKNCKGPDVDDCTECINLRLINGMCAEITTAQCPSDQFMYFTQYETQCVESCPVGYFGENTKKSCEQCDKTCKTCSAADPNSCLTCPAGSYYYIDKQSCVEYCPIGSFITEQRNCKSCDEKCSQCAVNSTYCSYCKAGYYLYNYQCIITCPSGTFANNLNNKCDSCDISCVECTNYTSLNCTKCDEKDGFSLQRELNMEEGQCRVKEQVLKEITTSLESAETFNTAYEIKIQSEKINDALTYQQTIAQQEIAKKSVTAFTTQATKMSKLITTSSDAYNLLSGYTELSGIPFSSTEETLADGLQILKNIETRTNITTEVYIESISTMSNSISRKIDLFNTKEDTKQQTLKSYSKSFFEEISGTMRTYTEKIETTILTQYKPNTIITSTNQRLSISYKTVEITTNSYQLFQIGTPKTSAISTTSTNTSNSTRMLEDNYNQVADCKPIDATADASVTVPEVLILSMPSSQGYLIKYVNSYINPYEAYNNSESLKSNVITYEIKDNLTKQIYDINGYDISIEVPLNENRCRDFFKYQCKLWDDVHNHWTTDNVEFVSEVEGIVECKLRKLGSVGIFEYDPNDYTRPMSENYGIYASAILLFIGIVLAIISMAVSKEEDNMVKVSADSPSRNGTNNSAPAGVTQLQIAMTLSPFYSIFFLRNKLIIIAKSLLLVCYFITIFLFVAIFVNHKEFIDFDITDKEGLIIPAAILAVVFSWFAKYILGAIKYQAIAKLNATGVIVFMFIAILYYVFCASMTTWRMRESDNEISKLWILGIFIAMIFDIILDVIMVFISHELQLPKKGIWYFLQHNGFTESLDAKDRMNTVFNSEPEKLDRENQTQQQMIESDQQENIVAENKVVVDEEEEQELNLRQPGENDQEKLAQQEEEKQEQDQGN